MPAESALCDEEAAGSSPKHLRLSVGGPLHDKMKCVWCMEGTDMRHPNKKQGKLLSVLLKMRIRVHLTRQIESTTALSDPYALDIMYHYTCWMKHIHHTVFKTDAMHLQSILSH